MKAGTKAQPFGLHQYIPTELFNREIFVYNVESEKKCLLQYCALSFHKIVAKTRKLYTRFLDENMYICIIFIFNGLSGNIGIF